jgi:D-aminoacyl-tRNA deacylase
MRIVLQRVWNATVTVGNTPAGSIGRGYMILLGIASNDTEADVEWLCRKVVALRICADEAGMMNKTLAETGGEILVVSQFTLHAAYSKGNRPSFIAAARPEQALPLYESFVRKLAALSAGPVATGVFGADMQVALINDGPVTIIMDRVNDHSRRYILYERGAEAGGAGF